MFFECQFPTTISYKAVGGAGFSTIVNESVTGAESRNRNWGTAQRGKWTVSLTTPTAFQGNRQTFINLLYAFFMNVGGKADGFRLKDHKDFRAVGQPVAANSTGALQLAVTRTTGTRSYVQFISKPITSAVVDYQGNALPDTVFLHGTTTPVPVDPTTGLVSGVGAGTLVDFLFHYPVRFDTDDLQIAIDPSPVSQGKIITSWNSIPLIEVLAPYF